MRTAAREQESPRTVESEIAFIYADPLSFALDLPVEWRDLKLRHGSTP
jgi:hypothetical protein